MNWWVVFFLVVLGIIISIGLPILRAMLPKAQAITRKTLRSEFLPKFWSEVKPYFIVLAFSILAAFIVMAYLGNSVSNIEWFTAIIYGFTWDSFIQKTIGKEALLGNPSG